MVLRRDNGSSFARYFGDSTSDPLLLLGKFSTSHSAKRGCLPTDIGPNELNLIARQVQLVGAFEGKYQVVPLGTHEGPVFHTDIARYSMVVMNHVVAGLQIFKMSLDVLFRATDSMGSSTAR